MPHKQICMSLNFVEFLAHDSEPLGVTELVQMTQSAGDLKPRHFFIVFIRMLSCVFFVF